MKEITLYHALFSTCSQKVRYAIWRKRLPFESRLVSLPDGEHLEDWYLRLNPNGVVPTLQHGDATIIDSSVICEYLDEAFPDNALTPVEPVERAQMRAWMRYFEEVPTAAIRAPSFNAVFAKQINAQQAGERQSRQTRMPLRKHFYQKMGPSGFSAEVIDESLERLAACLHRVNAALDTTGPFLLGASMTIADIVLLPTIVRMEDLRLDHMWREKPAFMRWFAAMQADAAFAKTYVQGARLTGPQVPR